MMEVAKINYLDIVHMPYPFFEKYFKTKYKLEENLKQKLEEDRKKRQLEHEKTMNSNRAKQQFLNDRRRIKQRRSH
jgi:hypothetical protein